MSRSRKKIPITGHRGAKAGTVHLRKKKSQRRYRKTVRAAISSGRYDDIPNYREIASTYDSPLDGKSWQGVDHGNPYSTPADVEERLRK